MGIKSSTVKISPLRTVVDKSIALSTESRVVRWHFKDDIPLRFIATPIDGGIPILSGKIIQIGGFMVANYGENPADYADKVLMFIPDEYPPQEILRGLIYVYGTMSKLLYISIGLMDKGYFNSPYNLAGLIRELDEAPFPACVDYGQSRASLTLPGDSV